MTLAHVRPDLSQRRLFGTDGVRGIANVHPMTSELALRLGRALGYLVRNGPHRHRIVIGKDTRLSGYMLEHALASGIESMGVDVLFTGPLPTPAIAFLTHSMRADAGAVISASHNPYQDNGIKFFSRDGFKLPDEVELQLEQLVLGEQIDDFRPTADKIAKARKIDDAGGRYIVYAKNIFPREMTLEDIARVQDAFVAAARRALAAGFEWLELHFAHGYLAHEFYSPLANLRSDQYGGSFDNRIRFMLETLAAVHAVPR